MFCEFVGVTLLDESAVYECIVVHIKQGDNIMLCFCLYIAGNGFEFFAGGYKKVKAALARITATPWFCMFAYNTIKLPAAVKLELNFHIVFTLVNEVVIAFGSAFAP